MHDQNIPCIPLPQAMLSLAERFHCLLLFRSRTDCLTSSFCSERVIRSLGANSRIAMALTGSWLGAAGRAVTLAGAKENVDAVRRAAAEKIAPRASAVDH